MLPAVHNLGSQDDLRALSAPASQQYSDLRRPRETAARSPRVFSIAGGKGRKAGLQAKVSNRACVYRLCVCMCSLCSCRCRLKEDSALSQSNKKSMTSIVATTSFASNITETLSAATLAPAARPGAGAFDRQNPMWWHMLSRPDQLNAVAAAHKAVDMLWFVHGLSFALINSPLFADAVDKIKAAPGYIIKCNSLPLSP